MTNPAVIHYPFGEPSLVPEALFISALIDSGQYTPETYQVLDNYITSFRQIHEYCKQHQADAKAAPTVAIIHKRFKTFPYLAGVAPEHAARLVKDLWQSRMLRKAMMNATIELQGEDFDVSAAHSALVTGVEEATVTTSVFSSFTDSDIFEAYEVQEPIPVSLDSDSALTRFTGGINPGNLWYVVARMGVGKTWALALSGVAAAEAGFDVFFYSTEMTRREVIDRLHRIAFRDLYKGRWENITLEQRSALAEKWQSTAGRITVIDAEAGKLNASVIAGNHKPGSIALVDYIGHMFTNSGAPAIEDWRVIAAISTELKRTAVAFNIPIICAAQLNRQGAGAAEKIRKEHIAQSDQLARDGDVVISLADYDEETQTRVRTYSLMKNRHGSAGQKWFTLLDVANSKFCDITYDNARSIAEQDKTTNSSFG